MDSDSAISPSSRSSIDAKNEEYVTASNPEVDVSDISVVTEKTLLPEENGVRSFPVIEEQKTASEDEGEVHESRYKGFLGDNSDFVGVEEQNEIEVSVEDEDEMNGGEIENANDFNSEGFHEQEREGTGSNESDDTAMELKEIESRDSGGADSVYFMNQNVVEEVERESIEDESAVVASGEVLAGNQHGFEDFVEEVEKSVNPDDVLDHKNVVHLEPKDVGLESELDEPFVDVGNANERSDAVDELAEEAKDEKNSINEANSAKSIGVNNLKDTETPELDSIDLSNDEVSEKGYDLVESPKLNSEPAVSTVDKLDQLNYSESGTSMHQEVDDEEVIVGLEHASFHGDGEQVNADEGISNLVAREETLPVSTEEIVVVDEDIQGTSTESSSQKNIIDTLDHLNSSERRASMNQDQEIIDEDEKKVKGEVLLNFDAGSGDLNAADEVLTLPDTTNEAVVHQISDLDNQVELDADESQVGEGEDEKDEEDEDEDDEVRISDGPARVAILDSPEAAKQIIREMERISSSSRSGFQGSRDYSSNADGQIVSDPDEVLDSDEDGEGGELFDSAALAALLKAATGSSDGTVTVTSQDAARIFSVDRPAGLGSAPSLRPAVPRSTRPSIFNSTELTAVSDASHAMNDDEKTLREKVEKIRVKFLRLVHRLGHSPDDTVAAQVLYRLSLAEGIRQGRQVSRAFSTDGARKQALKLEEEGKDDLDFSCTILVLGKTGVGKSATINSIFGEERSHTNPFEQATTSVRQISGVVNGVRIRVIDTPGLKSSIMDQATNRRILSSIKKFMKKFPPDIVLYVDRMDTQTRDFNDLPLLRSINSILGSSIWFNAIVALTHAASAPPDGPNGSPLGYEIFIDQRSHVIQLSIRQAAADMRLMNPVALVENHPSCRRNREGERVLPNGLSWRPQLLLLCFSSKILSEANSLLKLQDSSPGKLFGFRLRSPPLPFLLSSLLQSRAHPKLSGDHGGDNADSDIDLDDLSDAEQQEEEDEYDQLPPFKPLRKVQIDKLTKEQKKAYFDEYDYRVKLLQKKQWKEELRQLKEVKKRGKASTDEFSNGDLPEDYDQDGSPAAVQVPLPDMVLPPSFDCNNPAYRYRFLEPTSQLLSRPVLDTHGWDHDCGYDGVSIEENLAIVGRFPTSMAVQITKDKKEFNIHLDSSIAAKHGENGSTLAGFDIQSVGKQLAYILRGETKFKNLKKNKTAAGMSVTFLGETVATGLKVEDRISIGKRLGFVASTGAVRAQGDVAFGANLEARLKDKDYPFGQALSTLGLSLMKWRNDLALGANLQSQFSVGRNSKMAVRVGLNNKLTGQITVRTSSSEQLQIALAGIVPLAISIYRTIASNESYLDH